MIVPRVRTRLTRAEIRTALAEAHVEVFGSPAPAPRLAVATCQAWLETGNGGALWNYNFGNVDWLADIGGDAFELRLFRRTRRMTCSAAALVSYPILPAQASMVSPPPSSSAASCATPRARPR